MLPAVADPQRQHQPATEYHRQPAGLAVVPGLAGLTERHPGVGVFDLRHGFGQTSGSVTTSFRQGYAAAASMILFVLVLVIGLTVQTLLRRREERIMG
jgi:hypothetical protein